MVHQTSNRSIFLGLLEYLRYIFNVTAGGVPHSCSLFLVVRICKRYVSAIFVVVQWNKDDSCLARMRVSRHESQSMTRGKRSKVILIAEFPSLGFVRFLHQQASFLRLGLVLVLFRLPSSRLLGISHRLHIPTTLRVTSLVSARTTVSSVLRYTSVGRLEESNYVRTVIR